MLKMKKHCEKCQASTSEQELAYICSFECTFCKDCTQQMGAICPNCAGELLPRPRRFRKPIDVAVSQVKNKFFSK